MRLADHDGRAVLLVEGGGIDVATASDGRFGPDIQALYDDWLAFGPVRQAGNLVKVAGVDGTSTPDSAAWAR